MGKVRNKNPEDLTTRSNKNPEDLFSNIPPELILEILLKLPAKSIVNLSFVSKHWSSIIRDKDFTELYLTRSFTWPRLLLAVNRLGMHFFHSRSLEDPSSDHHHRTTLPLKPDSWIEFSEPVRGLICCSDGTQVLIGNPSTGQFEALPRVRTSNNWFHLFFGYDPVNDLYKVLCMTYIVPFDKFKRVIGSVEHQVFTLGAKQEWRMIECKHRAAGYFDSSKGICMDGVVYYLTRSDDDDRQPHYLISFNLRSEDYSVIEFPEDMKYSSQYLNPANYGGKIALSNRSCNGELDLWILKDASNQEWSKVSLLVPSWEKLVGIDHCLMFGGTLSTGELIFVPIPSHPPFFIICYDLKDNHARKVVMEGLGDDFDHIEVFLNHVESPVFIPKVIS